MEGKNIILVGFMGCGKTTIGKKLAKMFGYEFIDMDIEIEEKNGMKISDIFKEYGEGEFRKMETALCGELSQKSGCVIATGGGVIKNEENMRLLKTNGSVLYIKASPEHIYKNIKNDKTRPLLDCEDKLERIKTLMEERRPMYEGRRDIAVEITGMNSHDAAGLIRETLEKENMI